MAGANRSHQKKPAERAPMAQGIGESKLHGGGGEERDLSGYTCQGQPIPRELWQKFPFSLTDQARAQMEEERRNLPVSYRAPRPAAYDGISDDDKKSDAFRDALALDTDGLTISRDPMAPLIEQFTPRGHRGMFMSRRVSAEKGLTRGVLTYQPVLVDDGKGGKKEVTCGNMFLASVPEATARKSDAYWAEMNRQKAVTAVEKVQEQADTIMHSHELRGVARRRGAADATVGFEAEDQEQGDADLLRNAPLSHE